MVRQTNLCTKRRHNMKKYFIRIKIKKMIYLLLLWFIFTALQLNAQSMQNTFPQLTEMEKTILEMMEKGDIPGLSMVLIKGKNQVLIKNLGYADLEKEVPVTPDTRFELASCSKSFTALAVLQLAEQGLLEINDPVSKYFPGFSLQHNGQTYQITIRQLLHHTSGIPFNTISLIPKGNDKTALQQLVKITSGIQLNHIPGQKFEYATVNYDILGAIIEKVSDMPFEDYMRENIFKSLGLSGTSVGVIPRPIHKARGYKIGFFSPRPYEPPVYRANNPAAYVLSSPRDMSRWLQIQMGLVETDLTPLIQKSHQHDITTASAAGSLSSYAMGWRVSLKGEKQIFHTGLNPNFTSYIGFQPGEKIGVAVLANSNSNYTTHIGKYILGTLAGKKNTGIHVPENGLDRTAATISIIQGVFLILSLLYILSIIKGILKGKRTYAPLTLKKFFLVLGSTAALAPVLLGIYLIPKALANVTWEMVVVWTPISFSAAILLFLATLGLGFIIACLILLFPDKNRLKQTLPSVLALSSIAGIANASLMFLVLNSFYAQIDKIYLLYYFALSLFVFVLTVKIAQTKLIKIANDIIYDLRLKLIKKMFSTDYRSFEKLDTGKIFVTVNNDTHTLGNSPTIIINILSNLVTFISVFTYLAILSLAPTLITILVILSIIAFYSLVSRSSNRLMEKARDTMNVFMKLVDGLVKGYKELKLHRNKKAEYKNDLQNTCLEYKEKQNRARIKFVNAMVIGNSMIFVLLGTISLGFDKLFPGIEATTVVSFIVLLIYAIGPVSAIMGQMPMAIQIKVAWNRIKTFLKETPEQTAAALPEESGEFTQSKRSVQNLKARNILFEYESKDEHDKFVLGPLDFEANKGEILFITGGNGSGKTTLAKILTGLYIPDQGSIEVDGKEVNNGQLGEYYSVVFSDFHLFEKLYNVDLENRDQEIQKFLKILNLEGKVHIKNGAFSTIDLSGGQRKRLALLKCYLEDYPIYLFDEWAADQDPGFRKFFYRTLLAKMKEQGKIVIAITHDDNYFDAADKIIKMDVGKIELIENGEHGQLLEPSLVLKKAGAEEFA